MDKFREIINYLVSSKNIVSLIIFIASIVITIYAFNTIVMPQINTTTALFADIDASKEELKNLQNQKEKKDLEKKNSKKTIEKVPVQIYRSEKSNMPIEGASIDFVTRVIKMLEETDNTILDISYKLNPLSDTEKQAIPAGISVIQLVMTLNSNYTSFQDFVYNLYGYDYLATIKQIKVVPLKEDKKTLEITTVIWLYVTK